MSAELITNAIVAALCSGAVTGAKDVAKKGIADAYDGLKALVKRKWGGDSETSVALDKLEAKPDSEGRKTILAEELDSSRAGDDPELISAAQALLELIHAPPQGEKHIQFAEGQGIAQADRGSTASVNFTAWPKKDE